MKTILLFGAGKSATSLIEYLGQCTAEYEWKLIVCDANAELAGSKVQKFARATAVSIDVSDEAARHKLIQSADIVISMLPAFLHILVAKDCLHFSKNLLTASYIDPAIRALSDEISSKGLLFLGEMGLDPGIDHMSAMSMIETVKAKGGNIDSFLSHCGGLVAPESDDNPWHYKITWNPANVVSAGRAGAEFLQNDKEIKIPYLEIFNDPTNLVDIPDLGQLAWYANRDSLSYIDTYKLEGIHTFLRTTLRYPSFNSGWNILVKAGFTDDQDTTQIASYNTFAEWYTAKMEAFKQAHTEIKLPSGFDIQADFLGLRSQDVLPAGHGTSASIILYLLEKNLVMKPHDKDMVVMLHELVYMLDGKRKEIRSSLIVKGKDQLHTAMSQTVGLPLGIAAKLILLGKISLTGLHIPVVKEIYEPVLQELSLNGIRFVETENEK